MRQFFQVAAVGPAAIGQVAGILVAEGDTETILSDEPLLKSNGLELPLSRQR